jgi:hypothetical protein
MASSNKKLKRDPEIWKKYFNVLDDTKENLRLKCLLCNHEFSGNGWRARNHLVGVAGKGVIICPNSSDEIKAEVVESSSASGAASSINPNSKMPAQSPIGSFFKSSKNDEAERHLAKFVFTSGVSFHALQNPHFLDFCEALCPGFKPPSEHRLKHKLLDDETEHIEGWKQKILSSSLITVTGDGWTNVNKEGLSNLEALTRFGAVHVSTAVRTAEIDECSAEYIADIFRQGIEKLGGISKVAGICTDNESKMRSAWEIVEHDIPGIVAVPCCAHLANLLLKDIAKLNWITTVINKVKEVNFHITNHLFILALFRAKKAEDDDLKRKELRLPVKTRFGTYFMMLQRTLEFKVPLRALVIDPAYENADQADRAIVRTILSDAFWEHISDSLLLMEPIYAFLRYVDQENPQIGELYNRIRNIGTRIENANTNDAAAALALFRQRLFGTARKVPFHSPVHSAALMLLPANWDVNLQEKYGMECANIRKDFIAIVSKVSKSQQNAATALLQFDNEYKNKSLGLFQNDLVQIAASKSDPVTWWENYAIQIPELQYVATRVLSLGCSNSAAERNWSLRGFLHSKIRNRMSLSLQERLINVHANIKLQNKMRKQGAISYFSDEEDEGVDLDVIEEHIEDA